MLTGSTYFAVENNALKQINADLKAENEKLREALNLYRDAVVIDVKMSGPEFMGSNSSALKRAWNYDRSAFPQEN